MKRRSVSKRILVVIAALALTLGTAAMTVFAQPAEEDTVHVGRVVDYQKGDNWFSVTYAYDVAE